jgi:hypothetical protein
VEKTLDPCVRTIGGKTSARDLGAVGRKTVPQSGLGAANRSKGSVSSGKADGRSLVSEVRLRVDGSGHRRATQNHPGRTGLAPDVHRLFLSLPTVIRQHRVSHESVQSQTLLRILRYASCATIGVITLTYDALGPQPVLLPAEWAYGGLAGSLVGAVWRERVTGSPGTCGDDEIRRRRDCPLVSRVPFGLTTGRSAIPPGLSLTGMAVRARRGPGGRGDRRVFPEDAYLIV